MSEWDYSWDYGGEQPYDDWSWDAGATTPSAWDTFTGWGDNATQWGADYDPSLYEGGGTNWLSSILSAIGPLAKQFGGPAATTIGSLLNANRGSAAARTAGGQEADALNRGLDLQTAQWLQQQQNLAPYLQAGQQGLSQLQQLAGREQPALPEGMASIDPNAYGMPGATPTWAPAQYRGPGAVQAGDYRWNPQQGPQAADYRYTPGAVPTLSGQELLANDPGVAFRLAEGRKALESSAAAKGGLLSGPTLAALQRSGQELSSQEYSNAWNRASQQAQLREQWNQTASQMGWSQAESEARFREAMAQASSAQNWGQALQGQAQEWNQGFATEQDRQRQQQQWDETNYTRQARQNELIYGRDVARNETDYTRQQNLYRQLLTQHLLPWEQQSTLANLGGQAVSMYGQQGQGSTNAISRLLEQLGQSRAATTVGQALPQQTATNTITNSLASVLSNLNR